MSGYSWFNTANGGTITPSATTNGNGYLQFPYASWVGGMQLTMPFTVTASGYEITGYYFWWSGSDSVLLYDMCLWQFTAGTWSVVANSDVTASPSLIAGWNYLALNAPISLQSDCLYAIVTNQTDGFYDDAGFFTTYAGGIVNGPLTLYGPSTIPNDQTAGAFGEAVVGSAASLSSFPNNSFEGSGYPIDVLVQVVSGGSLSVTTTGLQNAAIGVAYDQNLNATGGTGPYTWSIESGSLPAGITLSSAGVLSGAPTTSGTSSFTVQVEDANNNTATAHLSIVTTTAAIAFRASAINSADSAAVCTITVPGSIEAGDVVLINAQQVVISETAATLSASSGQTQPEQLGDQQNAVQTVTPGVVNAAVFGFTASASDAGTVITISSPDSGYWAIALVAYEGAQLPLDIIGGTASENEADITCPTLTTTESSDLAVYFGGGATESSSMTIPSGSTYRETITSDAAVTAVVADSAIMVGSGSSIGGGQFTTSGQGGNGTPNLLSAFTIGLAASGSVDSSLSITTMSFANIVTNVPTLRFVSASGGTSPYTWSVSSGSLPAGLVLVESGTLAGTLSGTATEAGNYSFTLSVTDSALNTASTTFSITVVDAPFSPTGATADGNGVITWQITSPINLGDSESLRVLLPTTANSGYPHGLLFALPVASGTDDTSYGNGLDTIRELGLHNKYNLTVIEPSTGGDWLADNPSDTTLVQESYLLQVAAWAKTTYGTGSERLYLIGFSRTGIGGQGLFFHHPDVFYGVASWDFPALMTTYDGSDVDGTTGGDPAGSYGTQDNFANNYALSAANLARWSNGQDFNTLNRVWVGGYYAFYDDVHDYDPVLTAAGIQHTLALTHASEHNWAPNPGWVAPALASLLGTPQTNPREGAILGFFF